ncbi:BRCT domain-containing protein [Novipirellula artificiosorum]|uniref:DNA ligase n=1 Tax=Novipirellula artificiosorum TaxID=2528016 RepID=A0A5C6DR43_9BACT|nr:BRCT domain-containing protein [Novipirellula artificiosorum]TWU37229.1 DNA ligase [Novipirellula artificiosorum]
MCELEEYFHFTGPARLSRALHTLEGLLLGITIDQKINDQELIAFTKWTAAHKEFSNRHPFNELFPLLKEVLADGRITEEERADLLWCCEKFTNSDGYYSGATADMQRLQGILGGIIADGEITDSEAKNLAEWMDERRELQTVWPYAEIDAVLTQVLADHVIDDKERACLLQLFTEFSGTSCRPSKPSRDDEQATVQGICACNPEIVFDDRLFCITGNSEKWTKNEFAELITANGGKYHPRVTKALDYLIVGGAGNPCWAYACYGRKVEEAVNHRREGSPMLIVHEYDIWDALD